MARSHGQSSSGATGTGDGAAISLPVIGEGKSAKQTIRPSKNGRRRAVVLAVVQLLIIAHIVQWAMTGSTTTPIEPSEAMEFSKRGVVNVGLIFFALTLVSTLIFGRWFCGWGCHVVMLQDFCGWLMKKMGVRPKPFRSRLLMWVPLLLGLYMFIWPAFYRWVILPLPWFQREVEAWTLHTELTTTEFWQTFPGLFVAIPFLAICGFATVYFLGAKGFCTYGCPYGGFYAPLDEYAPGRIRVTDACEQCGHCTAVCTSNVRVHEEVREYGMVVDPGCMKCMDCVSVCPNDALYFGFGKSAAQKGPPKNEAPERKYDLSWREEIAFAGVFAAVFFAFRGSYVSFPLLMAAGVAAVMTWIIWKAWRLTHKPNANLHRYQLKLRGALRPAGFVLMAGALLIVLAVVHSATINTFSGVGSRALGKIEAPRQVGYDETQPATDADVQHARRGAWWYQTALRLAGGQWTVSPSWREGVHTRLAWLHAVAGDLPAAERTLRSLEETVSEMPRPAAQQLGLVLGGQQARQEEALQWYTTLLVDQAMEDAGEIVDAFVTWADRFSRLDAARSLLEARLERVPDDAVSMRWLGLLLLDAGQQQRGVMMLRSAVEADPDDQAARELLDMAEGAMQ